jgi:lipopolysaccharide export system permease protein
MAVRREIADVSAHVDRWRRQEITKRRERARYEVEIQKKLSIPFACVIFALIGGPLGVRVGRGGVGVGAGLSLGFFLVYYLFLVGGEELADRGFVSPLVAMWAANVVFSGVGVWLMLGLTRQGSRRA